MFEPYRTFWFSAGYILCALLILCLAAFQQSGKVKIPNYGYFLLFGLGILSYLLSDGLELRNNEQFRRELKQIDPNTLSNLVARPDGPGDGFVPTQLLFTELQRVSAVPAHHSHPTNLVNIEFTVAGKVYRYRIGADSIRAEEFWVFETARSGFPGREIGRIQSSTLGQQLKALFIHPQPPKP